MKALATAVAILTISASAFAGESFLEDERALSEPEKSELHATTRHVVELSDEQMDGVIAAGRPDYRLVWIDVTATAR